MGTKVAVKIAEKGLKKGFVANEVGISLSAFSKIISGETKEPKLSVAIKLARVLDTTVEELWGHLVE